MFKTFSAQEAAQILGINRHLLPLLAELKILEGIKTGRGRRYSEKEIEQFWDSYKGSDLSSPDAIRMTATLKRLER